MLDDGAARGNVVCSVHAAAGGRTDRRSTNGRSAAPTRDLQVQAFLDSVQQAEDGVGLAGELDPHRLAAFFVHDREVLAVFAVQVLSHVEGTVAATLAEAVLVFFEGGGALGAVTSVALEFVEDELFVVVDVTDHDGRFDNFHGGRHGD